MKKLTLVLLLLIAPFAYAATRDNDDSCDVAVLPAATLLLPYFEVDLDSNARGTTLFSVTNVTNLDRIAHVTLWTDRAFPVLGFNVYLTGYDVQSINLYDVIARGVVAPDHGTGTSVSKRRAPTSDPNPDLDLSACARLPGVLDDALVQRMRRAFTEGVAGECASAGGTHARAVGYATIDVVASCTAAGPATAEYWTRDLRYDNVLIGDYHYVDAAQNFAQGSPMVHIRAVPEGGTAQSRRALPISFDAGFERTFYGRYQPADAPRLDGRQPLPSQFAARWIEGGTGSFQTSFKVWRESASRADAPCEEFGRARLLDATDVVVFDEQENAAGLAAPVTLPATSVSSLEDGRYPRLANGAIAGWMYLNLDGGLHGAVATQNWVVSTMRAAGRFSTEADAAALGNGCSAPAVASEITLAGGAPIAPAPNESGSRRIGAAVTNNDDSCDIGLLPAATLLLPYFEVDLLDPNGEKTLFTIANTSPREQLARVTLWTDFAFPVLSFNVYLTGYDVQGINLYDVLSLGTIARTGGSASARGAYSDANEALDLGACGTIGGTIDAATLARIRRAFTVGGVDECDEVGFVHTNAIGYATVDLVRNCSARNATDPAYFTDDIAFDNVLIGDYHQLNGKENFAQGSPLVHIRAIPEKGALEERRIHPSRFDAGFPRTFYSRYQSVATPRLDARQPLPASFATRWIHGTASAFSTSYKIWREGAPGRTLACGTWDDNARSHIEMVRFDEQENPVADVPLCRFFPCPFISVDLPATSRLNVADASIFPQLTNGAPSGWMYLNLDDDRADRRASQNWVVVSMRAERRYSADTEAPALGNGCSAPTTESELTIGSTIIGPAPNANR